MYQCYLNISTWLCVRLAPNHHFGAISESLHSVHAIPYGEQLLIPVVAMATSLIAWFLYGVGR